jgi:hypothetical protein
VKLFRQIIFWSHLIAGVTGGGVIFIMAATGVVLMYERHGAIRFYHASITTYRPSVGFTAFAFELLFDCRPDGNLVVAGKVRYSFQEKYSFDELLGMFHLVDRSFQLTS